MRKHIKTNRNILLLLSTCLLCTACGRFTVLPDTNGPSETAESSDTLQNSAAETTPETEVFPETKDILSEEPSSEPEEEYPEEMTSLINDIITPSMSEYEKVKAIHDYLVIHVNYDYENLAADTLPPDAFTAKGALLDHLAVCEGYAKAFSFLCSQTNLEENRKLSILPYLEDPYCFTSSDTESQEAVTWYLTDQVYRFQIIADVTYQDPETKMNLILGQVKTTMESLELYGQISASVRYGIADYAVITITVTLQ